MDLKSIPQTTLDYRKFNNTDFIIIIIILLVAFWLGMKWADYSHKTAYDKNLKHRKLTTTKHIIGKQTQGTSKNNGRMDAPPYKQNNKHIEKENTALQHRKHNIC